MVINLRIDDKQINDKSQDLPLGHLDLEIEGLARNHPQVASLLSSFAFCPLKSS